MSVVEQWISKDRFAAKRLHSIAKDLIPVKRDIIKKHSAFASLLDVSPFHVSNELIDFIVVNTTAKLREFNYGGKRIVFTKDMVSKVFNLRSGSKPVQLLTKSVNSEMKNWYKGDHSRLPISNVADLLKAQDPLDEDAVIRHWDLLCCATVLHPGSGNMMCLDYLGSMDVPKKVHEFDWDEHILELAMHYVEKIQVMKARPLVLEKESLKFDLWICGPLPVLAIIYMDHLDIPTNTHRINYSLPRACFVTSNDFNFIMDIDLDNSNPKNKTILGKRMFMEFSKTIYGSVAGPSNAHVEDFEVNPSASLKDWIEFPSMQDLEVPPRFKSLYEKHKILFASDVHDTLKQLNQGLKLTHAKHMASLLNDVDAAMREGDGCIVFSTDTSPQHQKDAQKDLASQEEDAPNKIVAGTNDGAKKDRVVQGRVAKVGDGQSNKPNGKEVMDKATKPAAGFKKVFKKKKKPVPVASGTTVPVTDAVIAEQPSAKDDLSCKDVVVGAKEGAAADVVVGADVDVGAKEGAAADAVVGAKEGASADVLVGAKDCATKEVVLPECDHQKRARDTVLIPKWGEQRKKLRLPEVNTEEADDQMRERVVVAKIKEGKQQVNDTMTADNSSCCVVQENVPQPAVIIDSSGTGAAAGERAEINSPVRPATVDPVPDPSSKRVIPPGYWDDIPSFELCSQSQETRRRNALETIAAQGDAGATVLEATAEQNDVVATVLLTDTIADAPERIADASDSIFDVADTVVAQKNVEATVEESEALTPAQHNMKDAMEKYDSVGVATLEKKTRYMRAMKEDLLPNKKAKSKKDPSDVATTYEKFVTHTRTFKTDRMKQKNAIPTPFIEIGRTHCSYKSFYSSLRPRACLKTQIMGLWTENSNKVSKES